MLQELLPLRLKITGHVFVSAVNLSEHLITGQTAAEWKRLSPSLSFFSSPPPSRQLLHPSRSARPGQLSEVVICVFIWRLAELACLQSADKLDPRPAKASSEKKSIDPVTVRGRLSRHLGRNYSRGLALSRSLSLSLVAFWESWQTSGSSLLVVSVGGQFWGWVVEDCFTAGGQIVKSEKAALDFFLPSLHLLRPLHSAVLHSSSTFFFFSFLSLQDKVLFHPLDLSSVLFLSF